MLRLSIDHECFKEELTLFSEKVVVVFFTLFFSLVVELNVMY